MKKEEEKKKKSGKPKQAEQARDPAAAKKASFFRTRPRDFVTSPSPSTSSSGSSILGDAGGLAEQNYYSSNLNFTMASTPELNGGSPVQHLQTSAGGDPAMMNNNTQSIADYLAQLLKDKKQLAAFPNVFVHLERLLDDEIGKVRSNLFQINGKKNEPLQLPDAVGTTTSLSEKVYVPVKEYPDFNFVGRILGPRGMTTKQLEQETGCKIMVRGKGSMRDKKKEDQNRGKPNWEHLNDDLHVLITCEDAENRAQMKINRAIDEVKKLLTVSEGEDELKKRQLMELAIINGTYRDSQSKHSSPGLDGARFIANNQSAAALQNALVNQQNAAALRTVAAAAGAPLGGAPLILGPHARLQLAQPPTSAATTLINGTTAAQLAAAGQTQPPPLIAPGDSGHLLYAQYANAMAANADYAAAANYSGLVSPLLHAAEYSTDPSGGSAAVSAAAAAAAAATSAVAAGGGKDRRQLNGGQSVRNHPYPRN